jgi:beta-glucosidase
MFSLSTSTQTKACVLLLALFSFLQYQDAAAQAPKVAKKAVYKQASEAEVNRRVEALLAKLTLKEKVGQMAQITIDVIGKGANRYSGDEPYALDTAKCRKALVEYGVGSVLNTPNNTARPRQWWQRRARLRER